MFSRLSHAHCLLVQITKLKAGLEEAGRRIEVLRAEKEDATFQLANLQEVRDLVSSHMTELCQIPSGVGLRSVRLVFALLQDHDTLNEMLDFTSGKNAELEKALSEAQDRAEAMEKAKRATEAVVEDLRSQVVTGLRPGLGYRGVVAPVAGVDADGTSSDCTVSVFRR